MLVFVYGSLKRGFHNNSVMTAAGGEYLRTATTKNWHYDLVDLGAFPGLVPGMYKVSGELYEVRKIEVLDRLEGHPVFYKRILIPVTTTFDKDGIQVSTYLFNTHGRPREYTNKSESILSEGNTKMWTYKPRR